MSYSLTGPSAKTAGSKQTVETYKSKTAAETRKVCGKQSDKNNKGISDGESYVHDYHNEKLSSG